MDVRKFALFAATTCILSFRSSSAEAEDILTLVTGGASNPTVAIDRRSHDVFVAWVGTSGSVSDVYLSCIRNGKPLQGFPVRVNSVRGDAAAHSQAPARVVIGPGGEVYVAWQQTKKVAGRMWPTSNLRFSRSLDGGRTFQTAIFINDDAAGPPSSHTFHDMTASPDGNVYVAWIDGRRNTEDADHSAEHGTMHRQTTGPDIRVACSRDRGATFSPGIVIDGNACPCCKTSITTGPRGEVHVAWRKIYEDDARDIAVASSFDGGLTFSGPRRVHEDGWRIQACPHNGPSLAADSWGNVTIVWYTGSNAFAGCLGAISTDEGSSFAPPWRLAGNGENGALRGVVAIGRRRTIVLEGRAGPSAGIWLLAGTPEGFSRTHIGTTGTDPSVAAHNALVAFAWLDGTAVKLCVR